MRLCTLTLGAEKRFTLRLGAEKLFELLRLAAGLAKLLERSDSVFDGSDWNDLVLPFARAGDALAASRAAAARVILTADFLGIDAS
jgi:hypothetical protein